MARADMSKSAEWIRVGTIVAAHGLRGEVKVVSFTERADDLASYGPLFDEAGEGRLDVESLRPVKRALVVRFRGVSGRDAAERLKGRALCVPRSVLPDPDDDEDFYQSDLIGLDVMDGAGRRLGQIVSVDDFGAGTLLSIRWSASGREEYVPFTRQAVPVVDLDAAKVVVDLEMLGGDEGSVAARTRGEAGDEREGG